MYQSGCGRWFFFQLRDLFFYACRCQRCRIYHICVKIIKFSLPALQRCRRFMQPCYLSIHNLRLSAPKFKTGSCWFMAGGGKRTQLMQSLLPNRLLPLLIDTTVQYFARGKLFRFTKCKNVAWINIWSSLRSHFYWSYAKTSVWCVHEKHY